MTPQEQPLTDALIEIRTLRAELQNAYDLCTRILEERPDEKGNYAHLVVCSGDRRQPPGRSGITCCCKVGSEQRRISRERIHDLEQKLVAANEWTQFCHDFHSTSLPPDAARVLYDNLWELYL